MVPEGWNLQRLDELATVERGKFSARPRNDPSYYGGSMPFVQTGDISSAGTFLTKYTQTLNNEGVKVSRVFPVDTILLTIAANIGDTTIATFPVACPDSIVAIQAKLDKANNYWLLMALEFIKEGLERNAPQNAQKNINLQVLRPLKLVTPPLAEQTKIATILSTWDKAIATTEKLIENSKVQKNALMQQLLMGKKRFPGFKGKWNEYPLKEIASVLVSNVDKKFYDGEDSVLLCNYTDVYYNDYITSNISFMEASANQREIEKFSLENGDVVITKDSESPDDIAIPALVREELPGVLCGYHLAIVRPDPELADGGFLNILFALARVRYYFFTLANGATRFGLSIGSIQTAKFTVPDIEEQKKIAEIIMAQDDEISNLTLQLGCLVRQKKALMQQLLTGKRRVKVVPDHHPDDVSKIVG